VNVINNAIAADEKYIKMDSAQ